jgi:hypothetical protein
MAERFDLDAIAADDALLDLLSAGGDSLFEACEAHSDDAAVQLLGGLRLAVDDLDERSEPVVLADTDRFLDRVAARNPVTDPFGRKMAARGLALSVAAVAALSVSGVAAAVTGDPLAPYEKVIERVVDVVRPQTTLPLDRLDGMVIGSKADMVKAERELAERQNTYETTLDAKTDDANVATSPLDLLSTVVEQRAMARPPIVTTPPKPTPTVAEEPEPVTETTVESETPDSPTATETMSAETEQPQDPTTSTPTETPTSVPTQPAEPTTPTEQTTTDGSADTGGTDSAESQLGDQGSDRPAGTPGDQAGDHAAQQSQDKGDNGAAEQSQGAGDRADRAGEAEASQEQSGDESVPDISDPALLAAVPSAALSAGTGG